jgi:hypothetical protein
MRGSPLLRALLAFGFILLLGWPLWRLTHAPAGGVSMNAPAAVESAASEVRLELTFTTVPTKLRVRHLGKEIWNAEPTDLAVEQTMKLPFPAEGVDLEFEAKFSEGAPLAAMRVRLTDPDGGEHEKTAWGRGEIDEVLTFP